VSLQRLRLSKGGLTAGQKSAEGILGHDVGKASEALRKPKGGPRRSTISYFLRPDLVRRVSSGQELPFVFWK
jgi:hypothetical protein